MGDYRKIDIDLFTYGGKQDIELWIKRFTRAVNNMLADAATAAEKKAAYEKYIATKLDDFAFQIYEASENQANWPELSKELVAKLSDPAKAQKFKDKVDYIKWDGEIPLHAYENTILTTTSTLDPELKQNIGLFQRETFKRFMAGLPPDYQTYVDMGMPMRSTDIKTARERAEKYQDILNKNLGRNPLASWATPAAAQPLAAFAAFKENTAMQSLNDQISLLSLAQKENLEIQKETNKNITNLVEHLANSRHTSQDGYRQRYRTPSRERQFYSDSRSYNNNQQSDGRSRDSSRQYGNRPMYRSPYRSPNRPQYDSQTRNGRPEGVRVRYDQSGERGGFQGRNERKTDQGRHDKSHPHANRAPSAGWDMPRQNSNPHDYPPSSGGYGGESGKEQNSDREQVAPKKLDFHIPKEHSPARESRDRRQGSPYPSKEDF